VNVYELKAKQGRALGFHRNQVCPPCIYGAALRALAGGFGFMTTQSVNYTSGDLDCEGFLAYDAEREGPRPGVLIAHAWKGVTDVEKGRAVQLAERGYIAFALDLYGRGNAPETLDDAMAGIGMLKSNRAVWRERAGDGLKTLQEQSQVDVSKIAAIGFCLGGGTVLELARSGADLRGVVTFHGSLDTPTPEDAKNIKSRVLVLHGASDPRVPLSAVVELCEEMTNAGVPFEVVLYGQTKHGFTNPASGTDTSTPNFYSADADKRSFAAMLGFFDEIFQQ